MTTQEDIRNIAKTADEVKELSDEELRDLICGATEETRAVKAVWNKRL